MLLIFGVFNIFLITVRWITPAILALKAASALPESVAMTGQRAAANAPCAQHSGDEC